MSNAVPPAAAGVAGRHTILIVDDRPSDPGFVVDQLESLGHLVIVARPDLILLDAMTPDADGFELCRPLPAPAMEAYLARPAAHPARADLLGVL